MSQNLPTKFVDEFNQTRSGWARFSEDKLHRYRLARAINTAAVPLQLADEAWLGTWRRVVFLMLNPSTADAWKPDRTIDRCVEFARRWGADLVEAVNLFSFISPYPRDLVTAIHRGDGPDNDAQILDACRGAHRVVAAWGAGGDDFHTNGKSRAVHVYELLTANGIALHALGFTQGGHPKHPLARGVHFIPYDKELEVFSCP